MSSLMHFPRITIAPSDELRVAAAIQSKAIQVAASAFAAWNAASVARDDVISHQLAALRTRLAALRSQLA